MNNYIDKIGFEVEGGWDGEAGISPFPDISLINDHSINGQQLGSSKRIAATHVGELVSPPFEYTNPDWPLWLHEHWPNAAPPNRTNRTCGFHIHISTKSLKDYTLLSSKDFLFGLRDRMSELGKVVGLPSKHIFWQRMDGLNSFCKLDFNAGAQMGLKSKGVSNYLRYGYLNFSWGVHGTMEFRALPTFRDSQVALRFATVYLAYINQYLDQIQHLSVKRSASELKG
jgi:hypothetical protein